MVHPLPLFASHEVMLHGGPPDIEAAALVGSNVERGTSHQPAGSPVGTALVFETNTRRAAMPTGEKKPGMLEGAVAARSMYMRLRKRNCTTGLERKGVRLRALTVALETHTEVVLKKGEYNACVVVATIADRG